MTDNDKKNESEAGTEASNEIMKIAKTVDELSAKVADREKSASVSPVSQTLDEFRDPRDA